MGSVEFFAPLDFEITIVKRISHQIFVFMQANGFKAKRKASCTAIYRTGENENGEMQSSTRARPKNPLTKSFPKIQRLFSDLRRTFCFFRTLFCEAGKSF